MPSRLAASFRSASRRARLVAAVLGAAACALVVAGALGPARWARHLAREQAVWRGGVEAQAAHAEGVVRSVAGVLFRARLDVAWVDARGREHRASEEYWTLGGPLDDTEDEVVRSDPAGDAHALSWSMRVAPARWALIGVSSGLLLAAAAALLVLARRALRPPR